MTSSSIKNSVKAFILNNGIESALKLPIRLCGVFPIKNKVLMWNFAGMEYGDSEKYIAEALSQKNKSIQVVWVIKKGVSKHKDAPVKYVTKYSPMYFYHLATSKIWVLNTRSENYFIKRKKQYYIQTWHSALRIKKIEGDALSYLDEKYIKQAKKDAQMTDLMTCGSKHSEETYKRAFFYNGKIAKTGTPRIDSLLNQNMQMKAKNKIKKHYSIQNNKKIVLYAPTFRKNASTTNWQIDLDNLRKRLGNSYTIIARAHPRTTISIPKGVIDATNYADMQELIMASDILLTDYSGCCFDAMYADKKCILYIPDLKSYLENERNLYFDPTNLPFAIAKNMKELIEEIKKEKDEPYQSRIRAFKKQIGDAEEGQAANNIANIIIKVINNDQI